MQGLLGAVKRRLTYANVVATLALVVATGGTAYAAATIGSADVIDGSLRGIDVRDNTLTAADIAPAAIRTSELADGGVRAADIAGGAVTGSKIRNGTIGRVDLGSSARSVAVLPISSSSLSTGADVRLASAGSLEVRGSCGSGKATVYSPGGTSAGTLDDEPQVNYLNGQVAFSTTWVDRWSFVVTAAGEQRALLVFVEAEIQPIPERCSFRGFAVDLR